jgi:phenazine biosynthesis protein phzE
MTMLFSDGQGQYFVSATPEQHLAITEDTIVMNPIAGTIRKVDPNDSRPLKERLLDFLQDPKEIQELYHVLDEELKMMEVLCSEGGRIEGPFFRQNGAVIHTEYKLVGARNDLKMIDSLRHTLHAPTLVG